MGDPPLPSVFIVLPSKYTFKYMYIYSVFVEGIEKKKKRLYCQGAVSPKGETGFAKEERVCPLAHIYVEQDSGG